MILSFVGKSHNSLVICNANASFVIKPFFFNFKRTFLINKCYVENYIKQ